MLRHFHNSLKILILSVGFVVCFGVNGWGQTMIPSTTPVTQNFDGMGATLNLPSNWVIQKSATPTWAGGSTTVTQQASSGSPTTGGSYNWGSTAAERAAGAMTSGTYSSPNSLMVWYQNSNASNITQLAISYNCERYRINTAAASVQFYYSTDGSTWTAVTAGDVAAASLPTGASVYGFNPPQLTVNVASFNITSLSIPNGGNIYLRWNINTTGANSQGIGIDDVSVTGTFSSCTPPADPTGSITPAANPACTSTTLTYSSPNASIYWQTSSTGTSTASPTTSAYTVTTSGTYYVRAYNGSCWSTNSVASSAITINTAPNIGTQPTNQSVTAPATATFSLTATGTGLTYQWQENTGSGWSNISGATSNSYITGATNTGMSGYQYQCIVSGTAPCASTTSTAASLTVLAGAMWTNPITDANPSASNPFTSGQTYDANITVSGIGRGTGITASSATNRYSASAWSTSTIDLNDYYEFTLTPNSGYKIDFVNFIYTGQVSLGSPSFAFRSSLDGYSANIGSPTTGGTTIDLSGAAYQGITSAITFRFYAYSLAAGTTTYSINDFTFNGAVTSVGPLLSVSPLTAFGDKCTGSTYGPNNFTITGTNLTTANVTVATLSGYTYCTTAGGTYTSSLSLPQGGGSYSQTIYVKFSPVAVQSYNGNISVGGGGASSVNCVASGSGVNSSSISSHPSNKNVYDGSNTFFTVVATNAASYQWQENQSGSWNNLSNGGVYSNVTTATMNITGATIGMSGYQYRCVVTSSCSGTVTSNAATLTVSSGTTWLIDEEFTTTTGPGNLASSTSGPFTSSGTWFTASVTVANRSTNALFMSNDGTLTTPTFPNGDLLAFWMQCATGNESAYMTIEVNDGTKGWSTLATVTDIKYQGQYYYYTISTSIIQVRFNFFDGNNNDVYFDDVMVRSASHCTSTPLIEKVHVNSCAAADEGTNEFVLIDVDDAINVDDLIITFPSADPGTLSFCTSCNKTFVPNPTYTASMNTLAGCAIAFEPPSGVIPANSKLVVFTGSTPEFTYNLSGACGSGITYYVLYCNNTNTSGRFANAPAAGTYRWVSIIDAGSGCYDQVFYDTSIPASDGEFAYYDLTTRAMTYDNNGCTEAILPIELISFDALFNNSNILLSWSTATEMNNDYFEIEKSKDLISFEKIGKVSGAGNSNTTLSYNFTDYNPFFGNNYYRLKQTDFDGKSSESNIVVVKVFENSSINLYLIDNGILNISSKDEFIQSVDILDVTGKHISSNSYFSDQKEIQINVSGISKGVYIVRIIGNSFTETKKIYIP